MKWYNYNGHYSSGTGFAEGFHLQTLRTHQIRILSSDDFSPVSRGDITSNYLSNKAMQISGAPHQHSVTSHVGMAFPSLKQDGGPLGSTSGMYVRCVQDK